MGKTKYYERFIAFGFYDFYNNICSHFSCLNDEKHWRICISYLKNKKRKRKLDSIIFYGLFSETNPLNL